MSISYPKVSADIGDRLELCEVTPAAKKGHGNSRSHIHRGAEIPLRWSFGPINCSGPTHLPFQLHSYCSAFHAEMLHFPPFSSIFSLFLTVFFHFPWFFPTFFLPFSGDIGESTPPSPNCLVAHAPLKKSNWSPLSPPDIEISQYSLRSRKQLCLAYRLAFAKKIRGDQQNPQPAPTKRHPGLLAKQKVSECFQTLPRPRPTRN